MGGLSSESAVTTVAHGEGRTGNFVEIAAARWAMPSYRKTVSKTKISPL